MIDYQIKVIDGELYYFVAIFEKQYVKFSSTIHNRSLAIGWLGDEVNELGKPLNRPDAQAGDLFPFKMRNGEVDYLLIPTDMKKRYGLNFLDFVTCDDGKYIYEAIVIGELRYNGSLRLFFWIQENPGVSYFGYFPNEREHIIHIRKLEQQIPFDKFGLKKLGPGFPSLVHKTLVVIENTLKKNERIIWNLSRFPYNTNFMYEGSVSDMIREKLRKQTRSFNDQSTLANLISLPKDQQLYLLGTDPNNLCELLDLPSENSYMARLINYFYE